MADGNKRADFMTTDEETMRNHFFDIEPVTHSCRIACHGAVSTLDTPQI
jgi:hypothetical protein